MKYFVIIGFLFLTAACVSPTSFHQAEWYAELDGKGTNLPPAYIDGFARGADCGAYDCGYDWSICEKDEDRYKADELYRQGFDDGHKYLSKQIIRGAALR